MSKADVEVTEQSQLNTPLGNSRFSEKGGHYMPVTTAGVTIGPMGSRATSSGYSSPLARWNGRDPVLKERLVVELQAPHLTPGQNLLKRVIDLALATALLILAAPLLLMTAALIRLS